MAGLVPAIHVLNEQAIDVDARPKRRASHEFIAKEETPEWPLLNLAR